jgi:hypothetical protein
LPGEPPASVPRNDGPAPSLFHSSGRLPIDRAAHTAWCRSRCSAGWSASGGSASRASSPVGTLNRKEPPNRRTRADRWSHPGGAVSPALPARPQLTYAATTPGCSPAAAPHSARSASSADPATLRAAPHGLRRKESSLRQCSGMSPEPDGRCDSALPIDRLTTSNRWLPYTLDICSL